MLYNPNSHVYGRFEHPPPPPSARARARALHIPLHCSHAHCFAPIYGRFELTRYTLWCEQFTDAINIEAVLFCLSRGDGDGNASWLLLNGAAVHVIIVGVTRCAGRSLTLS